MQTTADTNKNNELSSLAMCIKQRLCYEIDYSLYITEDASDEYINIILGDDQLKKSQTKKAILICLNDLAEELKNDSNLTQSQWRELGSDRMLKILTYAIKEFEEESLLILESRGLGQGNIQSQIYASLIKELAAVGTYLSTEKYQQIFTEIGVEHGNAIFFALLHSDSNALTPEYINELLVNDQAKAALARGLIWKPDLLKYKLSDQFAEQHIYPLVFKDSQLIFFSQRSRGFL